MPRIHMKQPKTSPLRWPKKSSKWCDESTPFSIEAERPTKAA